MPLLKDVLKVQLQTLFENPGDAPSEAWGSAMESYALGIVPVSTTVSAASTKLKADLAVAFSDPTTALASFNVAFTTWATAVGAGMAGFVPVPPVLPVAVTPPGNQETYSDAADAWASLIHDWLTTGTSTPVSGGSPVNWS